MGTPTFKKSRQGRHVTEDGHDKTSIIFILEKVSGKETGLNLSIQKKYYYEGGFL